jgi:glycerol-3-phosphate dehydrogenase
VAIAGGKYTTYRVMAADAVDAAAEFIPTRVAPSITEKVPLLGADGYFALINQTQHVGARYDLHPYRVRHLLDRYGSLIDEVLQLAADRPELLEPITEAPVYQGGGRLRRRRRGRAAPGGHPGPADADLHRVPAPRRRLCPRGGRDRRADPGWSPADVDREVATYLARVEAEVLSQTQPDDESADALRAAAPEARAEILEPVPLV